MDLNTLLSENSALTLFAGGSLVGILIKYGHQIFSAVCSFILNLISFKIVFIERTDNYRNDADSPIHNIVQYVLRNKPIWHRGYYVEEKENSLEYSPGLGTSIYLIQDKLVSLEITDKNEAHRPYRLFVLRVFFANQKKFINKLSAEVNNFQFKYENITKIFFNWFFSKRTRRPISSVYTNDNIGENILRDLKNFLNNKDFYLQNHIPYKRNYLLYGTPGTGKSSMCLALASELNYNIKIIDLSCIGTDTLLEVVHNTHSKTIFVFEDIDAVNNNLKDRSNLKSSKLLDKILPNIIQENNSQIPNDIEGYTDEDGTYHSLKADDEESGGSKHSVPLSVLLNLFDGLYTKEGAIMFFTTNHIDKLDPALLRDGRMDVKIELLNLKPSVSMKMIKDMTNLDIKINKDINPASLQELIFQYNSKNISQKDFLNKISKL